MYDYVESLYIGKSDRFFDGILGGGYSKNYYDRCRKCRDFNG
jgi:hypothetical protein